jgi:F-type H+-transporting ATPase subunit b
MLQFTKWYFVLLVNFLLLVWIMNRLFFRPFLELLRRRHERISGSLELAQELQKKKEEALAALRAELQAARARARQVHEALRAQGLKRQQEILEQANQEAMAMAEEVRAKLQAETERARQSLRQQVQEFARAITEKLVGV